MGVTCRHHSCFSFGYKGKQGESREPSTQLDGLYIYICYTKLFFQQVIFCCCFSVAKGKNALSDKHKNEKEFLPLLNLQNIASLRAYAQTGNNVQSIF